MQGVTTLPQQLSECGRIRLGDEKIDPRRPGIPLDRFRCTVAEHDRSILEDVTAVYGGEVKPWKDNDGSPAWQAILAAESIDVAIPPDDSVLSIWYEQWRGGYCVVRCNGTRCQRPVGKGAAAHWEEGPCTCEPDDAEACGLVTRLSVVLLGVPAYGLFRLDTGSIHAAHTFPAVVAMAQRMARDGNPIPATLAIQAKTTKNLGRPTPKQNFRIPVLRLAVGLIKENLLVGPSSVPQIEGPKATPAVPTPSESVPPEDAIDGEATVTDLATEGDAAAVQPPVGGEWRAVNFGEAHGDKAKHFQSLTAYQKAIRGHGGTLPEAAASMTLGAVAAALTGGAE